MTIAKNANCRYVSVPFIKYFHPIVTGHSRAKIVKRIETKTFVIYGKNSYNGEYKRNAAKIKATASNAIKILTNVSQGSGDITIIPCSRIYKIKRITPLITSIIIVRIARKFAKPLV